MFGLLRRLSDLETRVKTLESESVELEELRRQATNTIRSLKRAAAHALRDTETDDLAPERGRDTPPLDRRAEINAAILARRHNGGLLRQG
jgi:hypothetical protein